MPSTFYRDMLSVPTLDADGVVRPSPVAARLKNERADRVVAKIVKGLFTWKTGELLPGEATLWRFGQAENGRDQLRLPNAFRVHDVLDVRWGRATDEPLATMWILGFYATAWFWATTRPKSNPTSGVEREAVPMTWPGP